MNEREDILNVLIQAIGEEGCGIACEEATVFKDEEGWKFMLERFVAPCKLGNTVPEARASKFTEKFALLQTVLTLNYKVTLTRRFSSSD